MKNYNDECIYDIENFKRDIDNTRKDVDEVPKMLFSNFKTDVKQGIYIFWKGDKAQYIGISRDVKKRVKQHFSGTKHLSSPLVFNIAKEEYKKEHGEAYTGERKNFPFKKYRVKIQTCMKTNWKISVIGIKDTYLLAMAEIHLSADLKTYWNSFKTH